MEYWFAWGSRTDEKYRKKIKKDGEGRDFDCIIGLSGGLDSSYLAYIAKEKNGAASIAFFHVDAGWNTDQAVGNIEKVGGRTGLRVIYRCY
nr:hypothetical protein GCM10020185_08760 [Pseudomonas brassicacearum subsp. brassicacearum]